MRRLDDEKGAPPRCSASPEDRRPAAGPAVRERISGRLVAWMRTRSDRLFRNLDEQARHHGWTVETGPYGLTRSYRDPRFDALRAQRGLPPASASAVPERGPVPPGSGRASGGKS